MKPRDIWRFFFCLMALIVLVVIGGWMGLKSPNMGALPILASMYAIICAIRETRDD